MQHNIQSYRTGNRKHGTSARNGASKQRAPLSERLKSHYLEQDLTYQKLSDRIGVSIDTVRRAIAGARLHARNAYKIERYLESRRAS